MPVTQPMHTWSDTEPQKRAITDVISIIDPRDTPVVSYFGLDGSPGKFEIVNWPSRKVEWLEDTLAPMEDSIGTNWESDWTTLVVSEGKKFKIGDVLEVYGAVAGTYETNIVRVTAVSTNDLTVTPNWDGANPTGTVAASGSKVTLIGSARKEGADADYERALTSVSAPYNYTQIFQDDLHITRSQDKIAQYGKTTEWEFQAAKRMPELLRQVERTFFLGVRKEDNSTNLVRAMGGVETFVTTNTTDMEGGALTTKAVHDLVQDCWSAGGFPSLIVCNAWVKRKLSSLFEGFVRTQRTETTGGVRIDTIATEFGELDVLMDRWCPAAKLYVLQPEYIGFLAYDSFFWEPLAKVGDAEKGQVVGEYTLVVKHNTAHGYLENISVTS